MLRDSVVERVRTAVGMAVVRAMECADRAGILQATKTEGGTLIVRSMILRHRGVEDGCQ